MRMITCKMRVSIPVLWYVQALCAYNQLILAKILDIARGLRYLHNHPKGSIIHGDLKGVGGLVKIQIYSDVFTKVNVLISDEGHALISDFGLSQIIGSSFDMTSSSPYGGSVNWMAPEILNPPDEEDAPLMTVESDVWAFGMTILVRSNGLECN